MIRMLISAPASGSGKTAVTCALLAAMQKRGLFPRAFKCGPDYIDPMFHSRVIGAKSANLDLFFFGENTLNYLLARNSEGCDISVIEGVMGFYDGMGLTSTTASSASASMVVIRTPSGAMCSCGATIRSTLR